MRIRKLELGNILGQFKKTIADLKKLQEINTRKVIASEDDIGYFEDVIEDKRGKINQLQNESKKAAAVQQKIEDLITA